jgi:hypothetical protein
VAAREGGLGGPYDHEWGGVLDEFQKHVTLHGTEVRG